MKGSQIISIPGLVFRKIRNIPITTKPKPQFINCVIVTPIGKIALGKFTCDIMFACETIDLEAKLTVELNHLQTIIPITRKIP